MTPYRWLHARLSRQLAGGLFVRLRQAFPGFLRILQSLRGRTAADAEPRLDESVIVVGIGPSALALLAELHRAGFTNVTVVSADERFGGKCVHSGCMPIEFALSLEDTAVEKRGPLVRNFVKELSDDARRQFQGLRYTHLAGTASAVTGNQLLLSDGRRLPFERLVLALGNEFSLPRQIGPAAPRIVSIEEFWTLPPGTRLAIVAEHNPAALALGDVAQGLGLQPTLLLAGTNPLASLPAYRYYTRSLSHRGVPVHERVRLRRIAEGYIDFESKGHATPLAVDCVLFLSRPEPRFIPVDGKLPAIYDIDTLRSTLPARPDIVFLGDGSGLLTVAEAELQARMLVDAWQSGSVPDYRHLEGLPTVLHGHVPLAMSGASWTWFTKRWREIDFRSIGWNKVHRLEGKLWYLLDETTGRIDAIHICHPHAAELICIATALMRHPVDDLVWLCTAQHPSAAEIFKVLANEARASLSNRRNKRLTTAKPSGYRFTMPALYEIHPGSGLPEWLDEGQFAQAALSRAPWTLLAAHYGLFRLGEITGKPVAAAPTLDVRGKLRLVTDQEIRVEVTDHPQRLRLQTPTLVIEVHADGENQPS